MNESRGAEQLSALTTYLAGRVQPYWRAGVRQCSATPSLRPPRPSLGASFTTIFRLFWMLLRVILALSDVPRAVMPRRILDASLEFDSELGRGSTFRIVFPRRYDAP